MVYRESKKVDIFGSFDQILNLIDPNQEFDTVMKLIQINDEIFIESRRERMIYDMYEWITAVHSAEKELSQICQTNITITITFNDAMDVLKRSRKHEKA